jgi:CheY-like chemotaxis protein
METGAKILVVDDNDFIRIAVSKMLSRLGYKVASADSGENGLSIFLKNIFDIVLADYKMPGRPPARPKPKSYRPLAIGWTPVGSYNQL